MSLINSDDSLDDIKKVVFTALSEATKDQNAAFRFLVLNTIANKFPNSRYVILRQFDLDNQELFIYTDYRSNKIDEIGNNPETSVLAYDSDEKLQLKLKAIATIHHQNNIALKHWKSLVGGKESYNTSNEPGEMVRSLKDAHQMKDSYDDEHFSVIVLKIVQAEILQLDGKGHIRALFDFEKNESSFLVP